MNRMILHVEGLFVLLLCISAFGYYGFPWWAFFVFLLAPDLSMFGYAANTKSGAAIYNVFHTYSLPIAVFLAGIFLDIGTLLAVALIWAAHIGMDRMFGFGLKETTAFQDTHMQKV